MAKFIKLTTRTGDEVLINAEDIFFVRSCGNCIELVTRKGDERICKLFLETISEIGSMLEVVND